MKETEWEKRVKQSVNRKNKKIKEKREERNARIK